jgi:phosphoribosylanthranilate isomerase
MPNILRIKVCGLTSTEDALFAARAGADGLGFVHFAHSPRHVDADALIRISSGLSRAFDLARMPDAERPARVLVVVDAEPRATARLMHAAHVTHVQLAGHADPRDWSDFEFPILRGVAVDAEAREHIADWANCAPSPVAFVLDHPADHGGTGRRVDTDLAATLAARTQVLLAGGLDAKNVAAGVEIVRPAGVDASSRLETSPGRKDPDRVRAFVTRARQALSRIHP